MIQRKLKRVLGVGCCLLLLAGCTPALQTEETTPQGTVATSEGDKFLDSADLLGSVSALGDGQLTVQPQENNVEDGTAMVRAPGAEEDGSGVSVYYDESCIFERATINTATGALSIETIGAKDVKKVSNVAIFGETQTDGSIQATRIVVVVYDGMDGE